MKKFAGQLAKDYGFSTEDGYFDYIIDSMYNGNRQQVRDLFNAMHGDSQQEFLLNYLDVASQGYHKSIMNICIIELTK